MRRRFSLGVEEVADLAGLRHHQIEEFEEEGVASAHVLLVLIKTFSATDRLADIFDRDLAFASREDLIAKAGLTRVRHTLWRNGAFWLPE